MLVLNPRRKLREFNRHFLTPMLETCDNETAEFLDPNAAFRQVLTLSIPSRYIKADFSTQYTSNVRNLNKRSLSASCSAAGAAEEEVTALEAFFAPAAFACCGAGTKDMHLWKLLFSFLVAERRGSGGFCGGGDARRRQTVEGGH